MKRLGNLTLIVLALALFALVAPPPAYAYLDLGSGSFLVQVLLAFLLGSGVAIRLFWKNIRNFFLKIMGKPIPEDEPAPEVEGVEGSEGQDEQ